jgi:hypothetical protein
MTDQPARWPRWLVIGVAGVVYYAALFFAIEADGGREAAVFFGTLGFAFTFPFLLLFGRIAEVFIHRRRPMSRAMGVAVHVAPLFVVAGLLVCEGVQTRDHVAKFERWVASPAPRSLRLMSAYTYAGINYRNWAFHFGIALNDLPKVLEKYPYCHEVEPEGFDLAMVRDRARRAPTYPVPPPDFKAVHRYSHHAPTGRIGLFITLYGDAAQAEFYAYGDIE